MKRQLLALGAVLTISLACSGFVAVSAHAGSGNTPAHGRIVGRVAPAAGISRPEAAPMPTTARRSGASSSGHSGQPSGKLDVAPYTLPSASGPVSFDGGTLLMLGAKFGIVLVLLLICLRVLKFMMPGGRRAGLRKSHPMVLHTEPLGDKHRVCLLDLGDSIVVVGVSSSGVSPITTIGGADEVQRLRCRYAPACPAPAAPDDAAVGEQPSFSAELFEARTLEDRDATAPRASMPGGVSVKPGAQLRPVLRLQDALRQRFAPAPEPAGDIELSRAIGRMRDLRRRLDRA